ncbi:ACP phosphodiesterase [Gammaproteobacteria bacterium]|nr:ACP phosphodiesterase [Gammaproteobacteria bacterium]
MNYLAHFALAGPEADLVVGSFLGDYIKGRLGNRFSPEIERGIRLHRAIDQYTDSHPTVKDSYGRLDPKFRRYAGIITDIAFDHLLALNWYQYYNERLASFSARTLQILLVEKASLTEAAWQSASHMKKHNSLAHYVGFDFLEPSFIYLSGKLKRPNPLIEAHSHCKERLSGLQEDFIKFYPELMEFCAEWKRSH